MTPGELVAVNDAFGMLKRHVDAAFASVAAEISRQSRRELGKESLAKRQGFATPVSLISTTTGASVGEAIRLVQVGEATAPRVALSGEPLPAKHPHVADAVTSGRLGMTAASAIITLLDKLALRVDAARLDAGERELVSVGAGSSSGGAEPADSPALKRTWIRTGSSRVMRRCARRRRWWWPNATGCWCSPPGSTPSPARRSKPPSTGTSPTCYAVTSTPTPTTVTSGP